MSVARSQLIATDAFVDLEKGLVDRRIFSDPEIYRLELERIFARAWNFMCHESQIPEAGDFFLSSIGEDQVIVTHGGQTYLLKELDGIKAQDIVATSKVHFGDQWDKRIAEDLVVEFIDDERGK